MNSAAKTKTYRLPDGNTVTGICTCGACTTSAGDAHGNIDFGFRWDSAAEDYLPRRCEIARERRTYADRF
jgi:hypothetical protein